MTRVTVLALIPRNPAISRILGSAWPRATPPPAMTRLSCSASCRRIGIGLSGVTRRGIVLTTVIVHYNGWWVSVNRPQMGRRDLTAGRYDEASRLDEGARPAA